MDTKAKPDRLKAYREKRDFSRTDEPKPASPARQGFGFVVQKHAARRLHYDLRLELDGTLLSWAVPEGPSLVPAVKRLAVRTEDHPLAPINPYGSTKLAVERALGTMVPAADRGVFSLRLILHGRETCRARSPRCGSLVHEYDPETGAAVRGSAVQASGMCPSPASSPEVGSRPTHPAPGR